MQAAAAAVEAIELGFAPLGKWAKIRIWQTEQDCSFNDMHPAVARTSKEPTDHDAGASGPLKGFFMSSELRASARGNPSADSRCAVPRRGLVPERVFIDATYTLGSGRRSGIERVVNNLRLGCEQRARTSGAQAATLISLNGLFYEVGAKEKQSLDALARAQANLLANLPKAYQRISGHLVKMTGSSKLKQWFLPDAGHMGAFKLPHRFWYKRVLQRICRATQIIQPGRGDLLILPDAYWARKEVWQAAEAARARGAYIAIVVYDLIPLSHPEFVGSRRSHRFHDYLRQVAQQADVILTISETVRRELIDTLPTLMGDAPYCRNITPFPLGSEFPESHGQPREQLARLFAEVNSENPYLTVAAFDPRKNHRYLLDAFDRFWQQYPDRKLCLVGRTGSRCNDILQRIHNHPRLGRQLFTFHDLSDAELQFCYRACRGVIFPSIVEGFGLPIVEAMWYGQRTLASDTPIHREVGGSGCLYFDLSSPESLVSLLAECERQPQLLKQSNSRVAAHTWSECADSFFDKCLEAYRQSRQTTALSRSA